MIDCRRAAQLVSDSQDRPLGPWERFQLAFHLAICEMCRAFARQVERVSELLREARSEGCPPDASLPPGELSPEARDRIAAAMERESPRP